jgi:hypothetical protein
MTVQPYAPYTIRTAPRRSLTVALLVAAAFVGTIRGATAESSTVGILITSDRDSGHFADPKDTKVLLDGAHTFANGLILGGSFEYRDQAFSPEMTQNLEGTIGYRVPLTPALSIWGSAGAGERWQENPNMAFPYYVARVGADLDLTQTVTWNVVTFRYRNAFDPNDNFDTPQLATGFTFKVDGQRAITFKIERNRRDGTPSSTGVSIGFKQGFR